MALGVRRINVVMLIGKLYKVEYPAKLLIEIRVSIAAYNKQLGYGPEILIVREDMTNEETLVGLKNFHMDVRVSNQGCQPGHFMLMREQSIFRKPRIFAGKRIAWPK